MICYPNNLDETIFNSFVHQKAYGQISTLDEHEQMSVRTVHLHYLPEKQVFAFNTHQRSQKARDIALNAEISACYWDEKNQIQFRFTGKAKLVSDEAAESVSFLNSMWLKMRDETRAAYVLDHANIPFDCESNLVPSVETRPPLHAAVTFVPFLWDVHIFDPRGYRFGVRTIYKKSGDTWQSQPTQLIY